MSVNLLSLDLDWFNNRNSSFSVTHFLRRLKSSCVLPKDIYVVQEHQYLYPWALNILQETKQTQACVFNVDEHHDFYYLRKIAFLKADKMTWKKEPLITCANFFAFMVHRKLISDYIWITNHKSKTATGLGGRSFRKELRNARSVNIREFIKKTSVFKRDDVFRILSGEEFHGFIIVRSPFYTRNKPTIYKEMNVWLNSLSDFNIHHSSCRRNYPHWQAPQLQKTLT